MATFTLHGNARDWEDSPRVGIEVTVRNVLRGVISSPTEDKVYSGEQTGATDANGDVTFELVTLPGLWYSVSSSAFDTRNFPAPAAGETIEIADLVPQKAVPFGPLERLSEQVLQLRGDPGPSAYQAWLDLGNTGTVEEFLASQAGEPATLVEGTTTTLPPESPAEATLTEVAVATYRMDLAIPQGAPGAPGGSDAATAGFIESGELTPAALAAAPAIAGKVSDEELMFNVQRFGAVADGTGAVGVGTDSGPAFLAAIAAADAAGGGTILVPRGYYRSSVTIATDHRIVGDGQGYGNDLGSAASLIAFDNDIDGVILTQRGSEIRNIYLRGGGTAGIGLRMGDIACQAYNVTIHGFGSHGLAAIDDTTYPNVNHSFVDNVMVRACGGNGVHVTGPSDSNAGRFMNLNLVGNVGWGIYCAAANRNWFQGHLAANGNGVYDDGNSNFYDVYIESGSGTPFKLGSTSKYGRITVPNYAGFALDVADAVSPAWQTWTFEENAGRRVLWLYDATQGPTPTTGKTWRIDSGGTSAGALSFYNVTDNAQGIRLTAADVFLNGNLRPFTTAAKDVGTSSAQWRNGFFSGYVRVGAVATGSRPSAATAGAGAMMFDTTLGKPIWSTGSGWVLADGTAAP